MIRHIFLDMDGVIVDFVGAALALHGRPDALDTWPAGTWDVPSVLGISPREFWSRIDRHGADFWAELEPYEWHGELTAIVRSVAPLTILSSPSTHPDCPAGKVRWLYRHVSSGFRDFLIGPRKYHCAKPDCVLIDDSDRNVDQFREHGGLAILFPQPWNSNHAVPDRLGYVAEQLQAYVG